MEDGSASVAPACNSTVVLNNHCTDDSISAASVSDMQDRLSSLELRVQQQEDELTVMKAALADVLRRVAQSEDMAAKKQQNTKGQAPLREAFSMSCIANGGSSGRKSHRDSSTVSVARKETLSSAAKSDVEKKKDKLEEIKEKEEPPQANDKPPSTPSTPQAPSPSSQPPSPHPLQAQRAIHESKGSSPAKRFLPVSIAAILQRTAKLCQQTHYALYLWLKGQA